MKIKYYNKILQNYNKINKNNKINNNKFNNNKFKINKFKICNNKFNKILIFIKIKQHN